MLPILVLLFASSAIAAPGLVSVNQISSNDLSGSDSLVASALNGFDAGDVNVFELNIGAILRDRSRQGGNQALTNGQAVVYLGEAATSRPGDACAAANYINTYTNYVATGNPAGVRDALGNYIQDLNNKIDSIVGFATNPASVKYKNPPQGRCANDGRTYQLESAWDVILGSAAPNEISLTSEQYIVAKRLYCAFSVVSNNFGAAVTASALPLTTQVFELVNGPLTAFLSSLASRNNVPQAAASLKQALSSAVSKVNF